MNKEELRTSYVEKGYRVPPVVDWTEKETYKRTLKKKDGEEKSKTIDVKVYEVLIADSEQRIGNALVEVINDGETNDENRVIENAKPINWENVGEPFDTSLRDWLLEQEKTDTSIFAIVVEHIYAKDEVAHVLLYTKQADGVIVSNHVAKRRDNLFSLMTVK